MWVNAVETLSDLGNAGFPNQCTYIVVILNLNLSIIEYLENKNNAIWLFWCSAKFL